MKIIAEYGASRSMCLFHNETLLQYWINFAGEKIGISCWNEPQQLEIIIEE